MIEARQPQALARCFGIEESGEQLGERFGAFAADDLAGPISVSELQHGDGGDVLRGGETGRIGILPFHGEQVPGRAVPDRD